MVRINDRWIENTECDRKWVVADNGGNEARRKEKNGRCWWRGVIQWKAEARRPGKRETSQHERRGLTEREALAALVFEEALGDSKCGGGWFNICGCLPNMCGCWLDWIPVTILEGKNRNKLFVGKINPLTKLKMSSIARLLPSHLRCCLFY